ncbi:MAG: GNAT family N-acetyltransferase [Chloroflexi bacterium]|nr:GNAT family N-acetyltransferase [Chloroflexota bacterium]
MTVAVRPATPADGPGIYRAWEAVRTHNTSLDNRVGYAPVDEPEFSASLRDMLARPESVALVAEEDGHVVGFVSGGLEANQPDRVPERHATIGYLYVEPVRRRNGIARKLFEAVAAWAEKQEGVTHLEMTVLADDKDASEFWRSVGFTPFIQRLWAPLPVVARPRG